jgi:hypothetical protein
MATPTLNSNTTRAIAQTAQYIVEKWTREIEQPFDKILQAAKLVRDRSGLIQDGGDTINIPYAIGVDARAKAASTNITYDVPNGAPISLAIDKHYYVGVLIEDIVKVQSNYELKSVFKERMMEALARQVDTDLMALYASAGTTVSGGAAIDDADILAVLTAFDVANTPTSQRRGIVGHNTKADLLGINKYVAYDQTGDKGVATHMDGDMPGALGTIYGMDLYHSGNVATSTTGRNLFFHKNAISLAQQLKPKFETEYSVDALAWKTALHTIYGLGVERASSVIELTRTTAP